MNQILIKIYVYSNDPSEAKNQLLINKRESAGLKYLNGLIEKISLNTEMIWMIFIKILKNAIQIKNKKC